MKLFAITLLSLVSVSAWAAHPFDYVVAAEGSTCQEAVAKALSCAAGTGSSCSEEGSDNTASTPAAALALGTAVGHPHVTVPDITSDLCDPDNRLQNFRSEGELCARNSETGRYATVCRAKGLALTTVEYNNPPN